MVPIMPDNLTTKFIILYLYVVICLYEFIMQGICIFSKESIQADILFYKYVKIFLAFFHFSVIMSYFLLMIFMNGNVQFMRNCKVAFYSQNYCICLLPLLAKHNAL